jgi:hypothetical protein
MGIIIITAMAFSVFIAVLYGYTKERKMWNGGISPTGKPWRLSKMDINGFRLYTDEDDNFTWISYLHIDKNYKNQ